MGTSPPLPSQCSAALPVTWPSAHRPPLPLDPHSAGSVSSPWRAWWRPSARGPRRLERTRRCRGHAEPMTRGEEGIPVWLQRQKRVGSVSYCGPSQRAPPSSSKPGICRLSPLALCVAPVSCVTGAGGARLGEVPTGSEEPGGGGHSLLAQKDPVLRSGCKRFATNVHYVQKINENRPRRSHLIEPPCPEAAVACEPARAQPAGQRGRRC